MKALGWLVVAAVMGFGALVEYGRPARGAASVGSVEVADRVARLEPRFTWRIAPVGHLANRGYLEVVLVDTSGSGWRIDGNAWVTSGTAGTIPARAR